MEVQFNYITDLAKLYTSYFDNPASLYQAINNLPSDDLNEIIKEFDDPDGDFMPVNLVRTEVARKLKAGHKINEAIVEEIKQNIRSKESGYFTNYNSKLLEQLREYDTKNDSFTPWQNPWKIFHSFFYRGIEKENVQNYLEQICRELIDNLGLEDFAFHWVGFNGATNFGDTRCWIALYPEHKSSHKFAYQFFLNLSATPEAGCLSGSNIKDSIYTKEQLKPVSSYQSVLDNFENLKPEIISLNSNSRNYFKFAPGPQAIHWQEFKNDGIAALSFHVLNLGDLNKYKSKNELKAAIGKLPEDKSSVAWNTWNFKTARVGDVLFANKGTNTCIGIGIISGDYQYQESKPEYSHLRKVNWITDKVYEYKGKGKLKRLFRIDTFSPTKVWQFILDEYVRIYPELAEVFKQYDLPFNIESSKSVTLPLTPIAPEEEDEDVNYWWLNANPKIWSISSHNIGDKQLYTTHNEAGNKRRIYKYFETVKPGDYIIGYESSPTKQVKAIYEITKGIHKSEKGEEAIEFVLTTKLEIPVNWNELKNNQGLQDCEVFKNNQGSLFKLLEDEYDIIQEIIDTKNIITERQKSKTIKYKFSEDDDKPFISAEDFNQAISLLKRKMNIILQGPPGVGKTFIARKLAYEIMTEIQDANIEMVQFHQSFSYEDFIQGLRPTLNGGFELRDGIFYTFCQRALAHPDRPFFFIIDEINRGNLSKIFGELMMLIESDKRSDNYALKLTYAEDENDKFYIPKNLYIIGTMNTADRSLAIVDYALRRRFAFINLEPEYGPAFRSFLSARKLSDKMIEHICSVIRKLNLVIKGDKNLGSGFQIGHSYFCSFNNSQDEDIWWNEILRFEIQPLLEEIWFDDSSKVSETMKSLSR